MSTNTIRLIETRQGCALMENTPRYDVMLHGKKVDQLYYNLTGYVGHLPCPDGSKLIMPESSISAFRRQVVALNREFAAASVDAATNVASL